MIVITVCIREIPQTKPHVCTGSVFRKSRGKGMKQLNSVEPGVRNTPSGRLKKWPLVKSICGPNEVRSLGFIAQEFVKTGFGLTATSVVERIHRDRRDQLTTEPVAKKTRWYSFCYLHTAQGLLATKGQWLYSSKVSTIGHPQGHCIWCLAMQSSIQEGRSAKNGSAAQISKLHGNWDKRWKYRIRGP